MPERAEGNSDTHTLAVARRDAYAPHSVTDRAGSRGRAQVASPQFAQWRLNGVNAPKDMKIQPNLAKPYPGLMWTACGASLMVDHPALVFDQRGFGLTIGDRVAAHILKIESTPHRVSRSTTTHLPPSPLYTSTRVPCLYFYARVPRVSPNVTTPQSRAWLVPVASA